MGRQSGNHFSNGLGQGGGMDPGGYSGAPFSTLDCSSIKAAAKRDGAIDPTDGGDSGCAGSCPNGYYKIRLVIKKPLLPFLPGGDYHWYRQNSGGMWSSKPGGGGVIPHGMSCPSNNSYPVDCGFLCVKSKN